MLGCPCLSSHVVSPDSVSGVNVRTSSFTLCPCWSSMNPILDWLISYNQSLPAERESITVHITLPSSSSSIKHWQRFMCTQTNDVQRTHHETIKPDAEKRTRMSVIDQQHEKYLKLNNQPIHWSVDWKESYQELCWWMKNCFCNFFCKMILHNVCCFS